jgi:hypothetical protein
MFLPTLILSLAFTAPTAQPQPSVAFMPIPTCPTGTGCVCGDDGNTSKCHLYVHTSAYQETRPFIDLTKRPLITVAKSPIACFWEYLLYGWSCYE